MQLFQILTYFKKADRVKQVKTRGNT